MPGYLIFLLAVTNFRDCLGTVLIGSRARVGQFPWLIQFHTIVPCGGVLVTPDWVLTAAQCLQHNRNSIELYAAGLNGSGSRQTVGVKATYLYPQFQAYSKSPDYDNNIALLKLARAFDMCDGKVRLLDIAPVSLDDDYKSCLIFGWQSIVAPTSRVQAKPVHYSQVLPNTWRVCMYMHVGNASYRNVFCTMVEDENGIRACAGNPGSPVVCENQYQRMVLLGIASWSNYSLDCGGLPTYLDVSVFRSWIWDLIFGKKKMEEWETGTEIGTGACQRERHLGGIYGESNLQSQIQNYTGHVIHPVRAMPNDEDYEREEDAYAMSWKNSRRKNNVDKSSTREITDVARIPELRGKLEPPHFDGFDDYTRVLADGGPRRATKFDVVRERDEQLSQYREIGRGDRDGRRDGLNEPNDVPSRREKSSYDTGKVAKKFVEPETDQELAESFDELELVMPDGIDDFGRSEAVTVFFPTVDCSVVLTMTVVFFNGNTICL